VLIIGTRRGAGADRGTGAVQKLDGSELDPELEKTGSPKKPRQPAK
jgi:hypothetical protein